MKLGSSPKHFRGFGAKGSYRKLFFYFIYPDSHFLLKNVLVQSLIGQPFCGNQTLRYLDDAP